MDMLELIDKSHKISKEKGFWEEDKNHSETVLFIMANVGEIVKSYKAGKRADWTAFSTDTISIENHEGPIFIKAFENHIKDTFEDEIANVIIRICDFIGGARISLAKEHPWALDYCKMPINEFFLHAQITGEYNGKLAEWLHNALWECSAYSKEGDHGLMHLMCYLGKVVSEMDIDIGRHIEAKLDYNKTRPYLYGRKRQNNKNI